METFTRDKDGAKFEFKELSRDDEGAFQGFLIQKNPEPKTINWSAVIELGLLCEFWDKRYSNSIIGQLRTFDDSEDYPFRSSISVFFRHCRILPDQVISADGDEDMKRLRKAGLSFRWCYVSQRVIRKILLLDIKPAEGYTCDIVV